MTPKQYEKIFEAFDIYDNSVINWERLRALGGDDNALKAARESIIEAREQLVKILAVIVAEIVLKGER